MKQTQPVTTTSIRYSRIGRKALQADRLAWTLNPSPKKKQIKNILRVPRLQPKIIAIACVTVFVLVAAMFGGSQFYLAQTSATQKVATAKKQSELRAKSSAADACRRKKAELKADQIGKVTYDELYDHDECDK